MTVINSKCNIESRCSKLVEATIEGFKDEIRKIYCVKDVGNLPIVMGASDSDTNRELGRVEKDVSQQKHINLWVSSIEENTESYNSFALKKYGSDGEIVKRQGYTYRLHLRPVIVTLNVKFFAESYSDCLEFADYWIANKENGNFTLLVSGYEIEVHAHTETAISFSGKDISSGNQFCLETVAKLETYVGSIYKSPTIDKVKFQLAVTGADVNDESEDAKSAEVIVTDKVFDTSEEQ